MKLDKLILANSFGLTTAILWVICSAIVFILPDFALIVTKWWMHGMDISVMGSWNLDFNNFLLGGITLSVSAWASGYVLGWSIERVGKK